MIDEEHAVMFAGEDNLMYLNDVYVLHMSTMVSCLFLPIFLDCLSISVSITPSYNNLGQLFTKVIYRSIRNTKAW